LNGQRFGKRLDVMAGSEVGAGRNNTPRQNVLVRTSKNKIFLGWRFCIGGVGLLRSAKFSAVG
jgi:hypothetical protein